jgi:ABC-2 type transport system permease protein
VGVNISYATLVIYSVYWMLGHLLYAGLQLATGIVLGGQRDSNQLAFLWLITALFPLLFVETLLSAPNGILARALSYIPLTSPIAMVFRMAKTSVPFVDIFISLVLLLAAIYLVMRGAAKILRTGSLMYGKRFTLLEVARWLREA